MLYSLAVVHQKTEEVYHNQSGQFHNLIRTHHIQLGTAVVDILVDMCSAVDKDLKPELVQAARRSWELVQVPVVGNQPVECVKSSSPMKIVLG